jgi:hypothetical protein
MARRSLSTQGRILAAALSVAAGGALVGLMATGDHSATATSTHSSVSATTDDGTTGAAVPYDGRTDPVGNPDSTGDIGAQSQPQAQTRTGGS